MLGKILDKATYLKAKLKRDQLQIALAEATTDDNWQASTSILHEIASSAYDRQKWKRIEEFLWDKLKNNKNWKKILKALNIVQFLLKNGPEFTCNQLRYQLRFFKTLESFTEYQGSSDRGAPIRERAKSIVSLLENEELLEDERLRAHQIRERMSHLTGGSTYQEGKPGGQMPKYQSYNSQTYNESKQRGQGYYNYGHGNYGDRYEDQKYNHDYFQNVNRFKKTEPEQTPPEPEPKVEPIKKETPVSVQAKPEIVANSPSKPKVGTITQQLLKGNKNNRAKVEEYQGVIKPDLSYKQDKNEEQLIDLGEQNFMEQRYHFESTTQNETPVFKDENIKKEEQTFHVSKQSQTTNYRPPEQQTSPTSITTPGGFDSFNFLGISQSPTSTSTPSITNPTPSSQPTPLSKPQNQSPQPTPQTLFQPQQHLQNSPPQQPQSGAFNSLYNQHQYQVSHPPPFNPYHNAYNPHNNPFGYNQGYQSFSPPSYGPPPMFHQQSSYLQPNFSGYYQSSPPSNPYANVTQNLNSVSFDPVPKTSPQDGVSVPSQENKKQNSSKEGNMGDLTDLSDIMSDISTKKQSSPKKQTSCNNDITKEHNNNIKIDPWAW